MSDKKSNLPSNANETIDMLLHEKMAKLVNDSTFVLELSGSEAMSLATAKPKNRVAIEDGKLILQINLCVKVKKALAFCGVVSGSIWAVVSFLVNNWDTISKLFHH